MPVEPCRNLDNMKDLPSASAGFASFLKTNGGTTCALPFPFKAPPLGARGWIGLFPRGTNLFLRKDLKLAGPLI